MLEPFVTDLLVGCSLLLVGGWIGEALRAGSADGDASDVPPSCEEFFK